MDARKLWLGVMGELELNVSRGTYTTWLANTAVISQEGNHIVVGVPNPYTKEWLEKKLNVSISESLARMGAGDATIEYKVTAKPKAAPKDEIVTGVMRTKEARQPQTIVASATPATKMPASVQGRSSLHEKYSFDNYVVGSNNDLAYAGAQAVATFPGQKYNPLFLYGGVGLGKTHLMQAIGNEILQRDPSKKVRYVTSEDFTREFLDSIQTKKVRAFADLYRNLDVLIVDDIQFLGNKEKTQEEFFHTFNKLHQDNKQVILSSDKQPKEIPNLEGRLRSRFEVGLVADIQRPDLETRAAIVQRKALLSGTKLPLELVEHLARQNQHNIRELEGALTQLIAYCEVRGIEPSMNVAKGLGSSNSARRRSLTPKTIIEKTAIYFDILPEDILGPKRDRDIVVPRQIAMYLMREELKLSYPKIASHVGGRDHTTAMHSVEKIEKLVKLDDDLRGEINQVKERIAA